VTLVEGAHNPGGAEVLASALPTIHKGPWGLVTGMCSDKDELGFAKALASEVNRAWVVPISNERDMPRERLLAAVRGAGVQAQESELRRALAEARAWARSCGGAVCIAGSLFLAGEVLALAESGEFEPHVG